MSDKNGFMRFLKHVWNDRMPIPTSLYVALLFYVLSTLSLVAYIPGLVGVFRIVIAILVIRSFFIPTERRNTKRMVTEEQWREDCNTLFTAWMYGNPPGGWSDPKRREDFTRDVSDIERRLRNHE